MSPSLFALPKLGAGAVRRPRKARKTLHPYGTRTNWHAGFEDPNKFGRLFRHEPRWDSRSIAPLASEISQNHPAPPTCVQGRRRLPFTFCNLIGDFRAAQRIGRFSPAHDSKKCRKKSPAAASLNRETATRFHGLAPSAQLPVKPRTKARMASLLRFPRARSGRAFEIGNVVTGRGFPG